MRRVWDAIATVLLVLFLLVFSPWAIAAGYYSDPVVVLALISAVLFFLARRTDGGQLRIAAWTTVVIWALVVFVAPGGLLNTPTLHTEAFGKIRYGLSNAPVRARRTLRLSRGLTARVCRISG